MRHFIDCSNDSVFIFLHSVFLCVYIKKRTECAKFHQFQEILLSIGTLQTLCSIHEKKNSKEISLKMCFFRKLSWIQVLNKKITDIAGSPPFSNFFMKFTSIINERWKNTNIWSETSISSVIHNWSHSFKSWLKVTFNTV